jgi:hypothetical protein
MQEIYKNPIGYYKICNHEDQTSCCETHVKYDAHKNWFSKANRLMQEYQYYGDDTGYRNKFYNFP